MTSSLHPPPATAADPKAGIDATMLYRALTAGTAEAIIATDLEGRILVWTGGAETMLGWGAADVVGRPVALIFTPVDQDRGVPQAELAHVRVARQAICARWHCRRDGTRIYTESRTLLLTDQGDREHGVLHVLRDVGGHNAHAAEAEIAMALRLITDQVDTAILRVDPDGAVVFANQVAEQLLDCPAAMLHGFPITDVIAPDPAEAVRSGAAIVIGNGFEDSALTVATRNGQLRYARGSQAPIVVDGELRGAVFALRDTSRRRQAEADMRTELLRHEALARLQRDVEAVWGDPETIYRIVIQGAVEVIAAANAAAVERVDGSDTVCHMTTNAALGEPGMRVPLAGSLAGTALTLGQTVVCRDTETDPRVDRERSRRYGVRCMIVVPIPRDGHHVGVLKISATRPDAFTPRDLLIAQILVAHVATAYARTDEAAALRQLRSSEERLQLALQASETIGIWDWDISQDRCYGDPRLSRLLGIDPAAGAAGLPIGAYVRNIHPEDLIWVKMAARRAVAGQGDFSMEFRVIGAEASTTWLFARGRSYGGPEGKPVRFLGAVVDITERKRIETSLRDAETNARLAVEAAGLGLWQYDPVNDVMQWDHRTRAIFGLSAEVQPTLDLVMFAIHPRSREALQALVQKVLAAASIPERTHEFEFVRLDDGGERWIEASAQAFSADGRLIRVIGTAADITERKRLEAALREDEQRFRTLAEGIPQLAWMADATGGFVWFNQRWIDYTGRTPGHDTAAAWQAALHPPTAEAVVERLSSAFRDKVPWEDTVLMGDALGHYRWFLSRAMPLRRADGTILRWFGTHTDIDAEVRAREAQARFGEDLERQVAARTAELSRANERLLAEMADRQRAEEALRQSQKMEAVGQLTGGIAHDFNNLLTGITGSLDLMRRRIEQGRTSDIGRYMTAASTSASRAAALTHRLLAFARRQPLDSKPVDLNALAATMEDLFSRTLGESIEIAFDLAPDLWTTLCDPHQLENALLNLVINARDAMPDGGQLVIRTGNTRVSAEQVSHEPDRRTGDFVMLQVSDTGIGMPPEVIAHVFEPFFTTKPIGQGTGLGLSMVYGFARQSEGSVSVTSVLGEGTTLSLYLPRFMGDSGVDARDSLSGTTVRGGDGETVLVVEDDPVVRTLVLDVLDDLGYRTLDAHDGLAGLAVLQGRARVDLLVTDVGLPGLNGRQLAEMGRASRPGLKVLFITGYAENAVFGHGIADASMQMITKPFSVDTLAARIRSMIASRP